MDTVKIMLALIGSEISGEPADDEILQLLRREISDGRGQQLLSDVYALAKSHDMAHLVADALSKLALAIEDLPITRSFAEEQFLAIYRVENLQYELKRLKNGFDESNIEYIVLKGSVLRELYPEAWMRTSSDIDILVKREKFDEAVTCAESLGYRVDGKRGYHDASLFSDSGFHIELHFSINEPYRDKMNALLERVWEYAQASTSSEYSLVSEYFVFYHVAHMAYHFLCGGCGLRPFADLYLIDRDMRFDRAEVERMCRECGILKFYREAETLTGMWFSNGEGDGLSESIADYVLGAGVYGAKHNVTAAWQGKGKGKFGYIMSRIFFPYSVLSEIYPVLKRHKILMPVCQARRWFAIISSGRFKKLAREWSINENTSPEHARAVANLFENLEL